MLQEERNFPPPTSAGVDEKVFLREAELSSVEPEEPLSVLETAARPAKDAYLVDISESEEELVVEYAAFFVVRFLNLSGLRLPQSVSSTTMLMSPFV